MKNLRLDSNNIGAISDTVFNFKDTVPLHYLFLHKNKLESISDNLFTGNKALVYLYLQDNQIATVHEKAFHGLTNLKIVALDNNKIASLKNAAFKDSALDHHAFQKNIPVHLHGNPVALGRCAAVGYVCTGAGVQGVSWFSNMMGPVCGDEGLLPFSFSDYRLYGESL